MYFYDTETCGFYGLPVTLQYARDDGNVRIHYIWERPAWETLELVHNMVDEGVCGFNLTFDHFHLQKIYNTLELMDPDDIPLENIHKMYEAEEQAVYGKCLRPYESVDLMLVTRKNEFQQAMGRHDFKIEKVHMSVVYPTMDYLNRQTILESYMHVSDNPIWFSEPILDEKKEWVHREFRNIVGRIRSSGGLKPICEYLFNVETIKDAMPDRMPVEIGYIPIAKRINEMNGWPTKTPPELVKAPYKGTWPAFIRHYNDHWHMPLHRKYALEDVVWTRKLYEYFGCPSETVDSALTAIVASCKWRGFDLDLERLELLKQSMVDEIDSKIIDSRRAQKYLMEAMSAFERNLFMKDEKISGKTGAPALDQLKKWIEICDECLENDLDGCPNCPPHEVAKRAEKVQKARKLSSKVKTINKLLLAQRLHPGYKIIGTKSTRMSGADGLNPQGIDRSENMRECFTLGPNLMGGDFEGFELTICDAVYNDPDWHETLVQGKKVHAIFGAGLYNMDYDAVMADKEKYTKAKSGLFLLVYGGTAGGIEYKLEATTEQAKRAEKEFFNNFPKFLARREEIYKDYRPLKDDHTWVEPKQYIESFMGHKRYFTLEWKICKVLYQLAKTVPFESKDETLITRTKDRPQTPSNALRSALYQTIKRVQRKASRAAINHEIQSPGADFTKIVQYEISNLQPRGVYDWKIQTMNVHDEVIAVVHDEALKPAVADTVNRTVERLKEKVPLLRMEWGEGPNWKAIH